MIDKVERLCKILDAIDNTWRKKIDWKYLDMQSHQMCILGQVFGNYEIGLNVLKRHGINDLTPWLYGVSLRWFEDSDKNRAALFDAWIYNLKSHETRRSWKPKRHRKSSF